MRKTQLEHPVWQHSSAAGRVGFEFPDELPSDAASTLLSDTSLMELSLERGFLERWSRRRSAANLDIRKTTAIQTSFHLLLIKEDPSKHVIVFECHAHFLIRLGETLRVYYGLRALPFHARITTFSRPIANRPLSCSSKDDDHKNWRQSFPRLKRRCLKARREVLTMSVTPQGSFAGKNANVFRSEEGKSSKTG